VHEAELGSEKLEPVRECSPLGTNFEFPKNTSYLSGFLSGRIIHLTVNMSMF
jgi:hypothetical protein